MQCDEDYEPQLEDSDLNGIWSAPEVGRSSPFYSPTRRDLSLGFEERRYYGNSSDDDCPLRFRPSVQGVEMGVCPS